MAPRIASRAALAATLLLGCRPVTETAPSPAASGAFIAAAEAPAPPELAREFRGAWISPVSGGEWPSRAGMSADAQKAELLALLDRAQEVGLNAVVMHVRAAADAFYPTTKAPWSVYLAGQIGKAPEPFYDPLAFAIEEAHRRGLELHAWFNPFRAAPPDRRAQPVAGHVAVDHPERVVRYGSQLWMDPGLPENRQAVLEAILEVVDRYDVDGVHIDDYFYPYLEERTVTKKVRRNGKLQTVATKETIPFPDTVSWKRHGSPAGWTSRADWRRNNIDVLVESMYAGVKARKPWVAVGISPFGIWRPGHPQGITGLDAYSEIFADARRWFREGWLDYLAPQLYWPVDGTQSRFTRLDEWWRSENLRGRHIWPGLHTAREASTIRPWTPGEIVRQIDTLRATRRGGGELAGHIHFRLKSLRSGAIGEIGEALRTSLYPDPALPPAMPWLGAARPAAPHVLATAEGDGPAAIRVAASDTVTARWWVVQLLDADGRWRTSVRPARVETIPIPAGVHPPKAVAVRTLSATGVESEPTVLVAR